MRNSLMTYSTWKRRRSPIGFVARMKRRTYSEGTRDGDKIVIHRKKGQPFALEEGEFMYMASAPIPDTVRLPVFRMCRKLSRMIKVFRAKHVASTDGTHDLSWTWFQIVRLSARERSWGHPSNSRRTCVRVIVPTFMHEDFSADIIIHLRTRIRR